MCVEKRFVLAGIIGCFSGIFFGSFVWAKPLPTIILEKQFPVEAEPISRVGIVTVDENDSLLHTAIVSLRFTEVEVVGGKRFFGVVTLNHRAGNKGVKIALQIASGKTGVTIPETVVIPPQKSAVLFPIQTVVCSARQAVTLRAQILSAVESKEATFTINPISVGAFYCKPDKALSGEEVQGFLGLEVNSKEPIPVSLQCDDPTVRLEPMVLSLMTTEAIPAFHVTVSNVTEKHTLKITATANGRKQQIELLLLPEKEVTPTVQPERNL